MTDRTWLPTAWMDEFVPKTAAHPDQFIDRLDDGGFRLRRLPDDRLEEEDYTSEGEPDPLWQALTDGGHVEFCWTEDYGRFTGTKNEDGSVTTDGPVPEAANCFWFPLGPETLQGSLDEIFAELEPGTYEFGCYCWSAGIIWRFEVDAAGAGHFVEEGAVQ